MTPTRVILIALALAVPALHATAQKPFDSNRDPFADLKAATLQAKAEHKNILLDFGGNWCPNCIEQDLVLTEDRAVSDRLAKNFVVVHVNVGSWHQGKAEKQFRSTYPKFSGVPHMAVLAPDGTLLHDQLKRDILTNPNGKGIDHQIFAAFLDRWSPNATVSGAGQTQPGS